MPGIDKEFLISQLKQEIAFARATGMPQFVAGLQRAKQIIEEQQPINQNQKLGHEAHEDRE